MTKLKLRYENKDSCQPEVVTIFNGVEYRFIKVFKKIYVIKHGLIRIVPFERSFRYSIIKYFGS